jgi:hypothetical protein
MKHNKGQSIVDMIFSIGIITLVLTGVVVLIVSTAKLKRISLERQKAVELSQLLIEKKTLYIKENKSDFWDNISSLPDEINSNDSNFPGYSYDVVYSGCNSTSCKVVFTVKWGDNQSLSVEKFFSKQGI